MPPQEQQKKVVAHRGGKAHGRENDAQTIKKALTFKPDIIEIDVHKSRDGVLYCYHGSIPFGVIAAQFFYHFNFERIQRIIGKRNTLEEILQVIPESTVALLDLKDKHIDAGDLVPFIAGRENVWVETTSHRHMSLLRQTFEEDVEYVLSRPLFFVRHVLPMVLGLTDSMALSVDGERKSFVARKDLSKTKSE